MASNAVLGSDTVSINMPPDEEESSYFDLMMIGRTGLGKSTVGNKFLGIDPDKKELAGVYRPGDTIDNVIMQWEGNTDKRPYFQMGYGAESVTKKCKLLSNESTKDRVLDTRGFADFEVTQKYGVIKGNLQCFRWILQVQRAHNLRFSRVLYFFPNRGPPERADGHLQEEIKVMHGFFGQKIFDVMVIIVTNSADDAYQQAGFSENNIAQVQKVFKIAFKKVTDTDLPKCPPVLYIPLNEDCKKIYANIISAEVISDAEYLYFSPEYPKLRNFDKEGDRPPIQLNLDMPHEEIKQILRINRGKRFHFENRCTRCAIKIIEEILPSGEEIPVRVVFENGDEEQYDNSYCHPVFIPKHSKFVKFVGGIAHILTLGTVKLYEIISGEKVWPGFTNSEEVCLHCKKPPNSDGCLAVSQECEIGGEKILMKHSKKLDTLKLLEETK